MKSLSACSAEKERPARPPAGPIGIILNLIDAVKRHSAEKKSVAETLEVEAVDAASNLRRRRARACGAKIHGHPAFCGIVAFAQGASSSSSGIRLASSCPECARAMMQGVKSAPLLNALSARPFHGRRQCSHGTVEGISRPIAR